MPIDLETVVDVLGPDVLATFGSIATPLYYPVRIDDIGPGRVSFSTAQGGDLTHIIGQASGGLILCKEEPGIEPKVSDLAVVVVDEPRRSFVKLVSELFPKAKRVGIEPSAQVSAEAVVARTAYVGSGAVLGNVEIGEHSVIQSNAVLLDGCIVGANVNIGPGAVLGSDGYGFERLEDGSLLRFEHFGNVVIENDVEVGANTCIDKGTLGPTKIGRGTKIDNLVHIAHNVTIGDDCVIIAFAMVGGSVEVGSKAWIAPSAVIRNGVKIGERATVGLGAVVTRDVTAGTTVMGVPARDAADFRALMHAQGQIIEQRSNKGLS